MAGISPPKSKIQASIGTAVLMTKKTLKLVSGSKLGIAGLSIIFAFVFMAVFAPWLAPYGTNFIAPPEDILNISIIEVDHYPQSDDYLPMVIGPTTPGETNAGGGTWFILPNSNGTIFMDFGQHSATSLTPFEQGNISLVRDVTSHPGVSAPISKILYLAQGMGYDSVYSMMFPKFDSYTRTGLLAMIADDSFVIYDPFSDSVLFNETVDFAPKWFSQDSASAAEMFSAPVQSSRTDEYGISYLYGPVRYVTLANETRVITYEFEYCWNSRGIGSVHRLLDKNMSVAQEPLAYVFDNAQYRKAVNGIYMPSSNGTLEFYNQTTNGTPEYSVQFAINGTVAGFTSPLGFYRSSDSFPRLFIPTATEEELSVKVYDPALRIEVANFTSRDGRVELAPTPTNTGKVYIPVNKEADDGTYYTMIYRLNENYIMNTSFYGEMPALAINVFPVEEASQIYAMDSDGVVWATSTINTIDQPYVNRTMKQRFSTGSLAQFSYFGSFKGTKFASGMTSEEMYNMLFDPEDSRLSIFQSIGTSKGALPPGTYESGNTYRLGTDNVGHDILTHLIYGSRVALYVGLTSAFFSVVVGTLVGLVSGYYGGMIDVVLMRFTDLALSLPFLPIVLIWGQIWGQSITNIVIILALFGWPGITRVVRAQTLSLKERSFVDAARVSGSSDTKVIMKHIAPNVLPFTFLYMTLFVAGAILTEAALSYLALGDPKSISWGNMLSTIQTSGHSLIAPWWLLPPGLCITILSMGFYLLGRGVDEIINPRLRGR